MSRTPDFYRRDSAGDPAEVPSRAHGRGRRLTVTAVIAGGLVLGGSAIAYAGTTTAATSGDSSTTTSPSQPSSPRSAATQRPVPRPHIDGTVASVSGDAITVTDPEGFTRSIVTSSSTTYDNGLSAPLATGAEIHATGTVDANHTSLDATQIGTRPKPPAAEAASRRPRPERTAERRTRTARSAHPARWVSTGTVRHQHSEHAGRTVHHRRLVGLQVHSGNC